MKTGNLNGVDLTSDGAGTNYLADDGTYKAVSGSQDLQSAYDNSTDPEILTDSSRNALTIKRGSGADTDNVLEVQNGAGTNTFSVDGNGDLTANSLDVGDILNLESTTNGSPSTGDMWNDGIYITIQQNFKVRSDKPVFEMRSTKNGTWSVGERKGAINFYSDDASGGGAGVHAFIQAQAASTAGDATDLSFGVTNSGGAATEGLRLKSNGVLNYANAPTSSAGLVAGDIWNDSGTLKIV